MRAWESAFRKALKAYESEVGKLVYLVGIGHGIY